jgi:photosystem II stability/assembly factor-like uncharacterized protein
MNDAYRYSEGAAIVRDLVARNDRLTKRVSRLRRVACGLAAVVLLGALVAATAAFARQRQRASLAAQPTTSHVATEPRLVADWASHERLRGAWADHLETYAVGEGGAIVHHDAGGGWTRLVSPTTQTLRAVDMFGVDANRVGYAVGDGGVILRFDATRRTWTEEQSPTKEDLLGVAVAWPAVIAVGRNGTLLTRAWSGPPTWNVVDVATKSDLRAVFIAPHLWRIPRSIYVAGDAGTLLVHSVDAFANGTTSAWTKQKAGSADDFTAIAGTAEDIFVGGRGGTLLHSSPEASGPWTPVASGMSDDIAALTVAQEVVGAPALFVAGASGSVARIDVRRRALGRQMLSTPTRAPLRAAANELHDRWQGTTRNVYLFGDDGRVFRWTPLAERTY